MRTKAYVAILTFIFLATATVVGQNRELANTRWQLTDAYGKAITHSAPTLAISDEGTKFTGNTGCNTMFGSVRIKGRKISFHAIGTTRRYCKPAEGEIAETIFLKALGEISSFRQIGSRLDLADNRGRTVLSFARVSEDSSSTKGLADKRWILESIKGRNSSDALPKAFLNFDSKKGSAGGDTGCNVFGSDYKVNGTKITFSNIISTLRACVEDEKKMLVERELLDALQRATRFEIVDGMLYLYSGNELLLKFRGVNK